ncbi:MAG TPA: tRNA (5-methylaminomethyl-2-thiouridine)(34)-methyltransferase MnmD [Fulvivirga sp.]|nr:tRNA (5-methylaminomethyl-2-thiouridine)(34)-methyltransferase MnmD [Fulvivirga sp.]
MQDHKGDLELIITKDGSHSLYNPALNETYHSTHGALQESRYVFLQQGLDYFISQKDVKEINIFEVGLGTGLNALLTIKWAKENGIKVNYHSIEAYPITTTQAKALNYAQIIGGDDVENWSEMIHQLDWETEHVITDTFSFKKINSKIEDYTLMGSIYDIIFFDAFAPSKQIEMWGLDILSRLVESMKKKAVFVTYCAQGQLKRNLKELGLIVETLDGPPGKKEMVRGTAS